jgi:hypothetical protein
MHPFFMFLLYILSRDILKDYKYHCIYFSNMKIKFALQKNQIPIML